MRMRNKIVILTFLILFVVSLGGCSSSDPPDAEVVSTTEASSEDEGTSVESNTADEEQPVDQTDAESTVETDVEPIAKAEEVKQPVIQEITPDPVIVAISETDSLGLAISVTEKDFLNSNGVHVIEKTYVLPYTADIADLAAKRILVNGVEYSIEHITKSQNFIDKVYETSQVTGSKDAAGDFPQKYEYSGTDGVGILERDPESLVVGVNNTTTKTHGKSATKTYTMNIKDESQIPQSIVSGGVTLRLQSVSWQEMGDNASSEVAGETEQTVSRSFKATAKYSGSYNTSSSDYKGTVKYVGRILATNSPTDTYVVTYKPSAPVVNASGNYASNLQNKLYPSVDQENRDWQEAQFRQGMEDNVSAMQINIDELRAASISMAKTSQTMFMVMMIVLILLVILVLGFIINKIRTMPVKGFKEPEKRNDSSEEL